MTLMIWQEQGLWLGALISSSCPHGHCTNMSKHTHTHIHTCFNLTFQHWWEELKTTFSGSMASGWLSHWWNISVQWNEHCPLPQVHQVIKLTQWTPVSSLLTLLSVFSALCGQEYSLCVCSLPHVEGSHVEAFHAEDQGASATKWGFACSLPFIPPLISMPTLWNFSSSTHREDPWQHM